MVRRVRRHSEQRLRLEPPGSLGLDTETTPELVSERAFIVSQWIRLSSQAVARAKGGKKIAQGTDVASAWTFGSDSIYGKIAANTELLIGKGGFVVLFTGTAVRPASSKAAHYLATRVSGKAYGPFSITISDSGILTAAWRKDSDESEVSIATTSAIAAGADFGGMFTYTPEEGGGTSRLYINGAEAGTAVTSIGADEQPMIDTVDWYFGVEWNPSTPGVTADTHYDGVFDAFTLKSLAGTRASEGDPSLIETMRKWSRAQYPAPGDLSVLAFYDFSEGSGAVLTDRSRHKNDGTIVGAASSATKVAYAHSTVNHVGRFEANDGSLENEVFIGGDLFTEQVRQGN